ncbi:hypothetical protein BESB_063300 [Besnoitia besnoiti]|uniref:Protein farnesyltransferase/geranylgeranyltransferase type-1 subunit alpha n=1 Tax=Besnoitia besnoiti TaxID=94643 RepID=A0A2A9MIH9_BESBE|nr:hypothetical protein BESB_063300 [Besnoitia besnoiti]PFH35443.1 hypothetical protein BESB_063300 [Besnoitia besnoiti]
MEALLRREGKKKTRGDGSPHSVRRGDEVAAIACRPQDRRRFDALHALYQTGARALDADLLEEINAALEVNSGSYTVWMLRRRILSASPSLIDADELEFIRDWTKASLKNYQVWFHRRWVVEQCVSRMREEAAKAGRDAEKDVRVFCEEELEDLTDVLSKDAKNMSAWSHRVWLRSVCPRPVAADVAWGLRWIRADPFNNSAWMFRRLLASAQARGEGEADCGARKPEGDPTTQRPQAPAAAEREAEGDAADADGGAKSVSRRATETKTAELARRRRMRTWLDEVRFSLVCWRTTPGNEAALRYLLDAANQSLAALAEAQKAGVADKADAVHREPEADSRASCGGAPSAAQLEREEGDLSREELIGVLQRAAEHVLSRVTRGKPQRATSSSRASAASPASAASSAEASRDPPSASTEPTSRLSVPAEDSRVVLSGSPRGEEKGAMRFALELLLFCALEESNFLHAAQISDELARVDPIRKAYWAWRSDEYLRR